MTSIFWWAWAGSASLTTNAKSSTHESVRDGSCSPQRSEDYKQQPDGAPLLASAKRGRRHAQNCVLWLADEGNVAFEYGVFAKTIDKAEHPVVHAYLL